MTNKKKDDAKNNKNLLKEFFDSIRDEHEGKITKEKLNSVAKELGYELTEQELDDMIGVADPAGSGVVSYKGLAKMVHDSHTEFPRLKTSIEDIRRELTTLSIAATQQENEEASTSNANDTDNTANNNMTEPTPSTSKMDDNTTPSLVNGHEDEHDIKNEDGDNNNELLETDNAVVIGRVMKAHENDNRKSTVTSKGKGLKTKSRPPLVVPVSMTADDDTGTIVEDGANNGAGVSQTPVKHNDTENENSLVIPVLIPETETKQEKKNNTNTREKSQSDSDIVNQNEVANEAASKETERIPEEVFSPVDDSDNVLEGDPTRDNQSRQSAATRFSLDAGVVTAVDEYHLKKIKNRARRKLDKQNEEMLLEEDELSAKTDVGYIEESGETTNDNKAYIRDKTRRIRRKASLSQSLDDTTKQPTVKPVVRKRSLSRSRAPKAKGPSKPNDRHNVFYSGLGCALKISQLRTKQRLLYQMWQLVYDEAMMRLQQTFHYDYARDPAPVAKDKQFKPKKKIKKRNSSSDIND